MWAMCCPTPVAVVAAGAAVAAVAAAAVAGALVDAAGETPRCSGGLCLCAFLSSFFFVVSVFRLFMGV